MQEIEFNLLDEQWIRVRLLDNTVVEVSLMEVLLNAQKYADLAGETPTQDAAMLRLLLAILITVFSRVNVSGEPAPIEQKQDALERWKSLLEQEYFPEKPIREYLEKYREKFWLFHPKYPFWQVSEAKIGTQYGAAKLNGEISESSNKLRLFASYTGAEKNELTYSQAARWLLYVNGYDDTSAKPKGKGLPSVGAGWLGKIGFIQAQGENLFETLMLNLTFLKDGQDVWQENRPCWERETPKSDERTEILQPNNLAELLTLQSRRLLLQREGEKVTGFFLLGGDFFPRENAFVEQMTIWRSTAVKKNEPVDYVPCRHDPAKQFWREFPAVFCDQSKNHKPGLVRWIQTLQSRRKNWLDPKKKIHFKISGVQYGDKDFFVNDSFCDTLTFQAALLDELSESWQARITDEIERCEETAKLVGIFAQNLATAAGGEEKKAAEPAKSQFYFRIDQPFRDWLQSIDPETDKKFKAIEEWQNTVHKIAERLGQEMIYEAGDAAIKGRRIKLDAGKKTERTILCTAPGAYNRFLGQLWKIYPKNDSKGGTE